jgi:NhaP-type Na+/H+ or K+/H+ antiporter
MVPVAIALIGTGMRFRSISFIGWFGPRGLASLVFAGTVVVEAESDKAAFIVAAVSTVVAMSIVAHGVTAIPWSRRYGGWYRRHSKKDTDMSESMEVEHMPYRRRLEVEPKRR